MGATPITFEEISDAKQFQAALRNGAINSKYGASVTVNPVEEYTGDNVRLFLGKDKKVGFALKDGDIISVFKHDKSDTDHTLYSLLTLAIQEGGKTLDCFDTVLPKNYARLGFVAVARTPWNDAYKPTDPVAWDYELYKKYNDGRPDVVIMALDHDSSGRYIKGEGQMFHDIVNEDGSVNDGWSQGAELRSKWMEQRAKEQEDSPRFWRK